MTPQFGQVNIHEKKYPNIFLRKVVKELFDKVCLLNFQLEYYELIMHILRDLVVSQEHL